MKSTLLEIVQNILSSMDSSEVNSISDNTESRQVAQIVRNTYFNILTRANFPEQHQIFSLDASGDSTQPVLMIKPENVARIDWMKYNTLDNDLDSYTYVTMLPFQQFRDMIDTFNTSESNVDSFSYNNHTFYYKDDKEPQYCTVVDNNFIIFDSYDSEVDDTLQTSKTLCYGYVVPVFTLSDTFVPELEDLQFPLLIAEAKSVAFLELKQVANDAAIRESKRQWTSLQRTKDLKKPSAFDQLANFGRK